MNLLTRQRPSATVHCFAPVYGLKARAPPNQFGQTLKPPILAFVLRVMCALGADAHHAILPAALRLPLSSGRTSKCSLLSAVT